METRLDWLSRLLGLVPVTGRLDHRCFLGAPWRIEYEPSPAGVMPFHIVLGGAVTFEELNGIRRTGTPAKAGVKNAMRDKAGPRQLQPGDIVLLTHGSAHALHDGSGAPPEPYRDRATLNLLISENAGTGARIDVLCGSFRIAPAHAAMLQRYLPENFVVSAPEMSAATTKSGTGAELAALIALLRMESAEERLGGAAMLDALSTALFALILRLASEDDAPADKTGLLALAGNPRLAPALTAMFNEPAQPWTLPALAGLCNMSRATFIRHFQERLGRSAMELLTEIRMTLAANMLATSDSSTGIVAELAGYQSEAAFQRSFKQATGMTPAQWRREGRK